MASSLWSACGSSIPSLHNMLNRLLRCLCRARDVPFLQIVVLNDVRDAANLEPGNAMNDRSLGRGRAFHILTERLVPFFQFPRPGRSAGAGGEGHEPANMNAGVHFPGGEAFVCRSEQLLARRKAVVEESVLFLYEGDADIFSILEAFGCQDALVPGNLFRCQGNIADVRAGGRVCASHAEDDDRLGVESRYQERDSMRGVRFAHAAGAQYGLLAGGPPSEKDLRPEGEGFFHAHGSAE